MNIQAVSSTSSSSQDQSSAVQTDPQVKQLKSQIADWSTCPTTPPDMKKAIVAKLQFQLDSVEKSLNNHEQAVKAANVASASSSGNVRMASPPVVVSQFSGSRKVNVTV